MKKIYFLVALGFALLAGAQQANAQSIKTNMPFLLAGSPNIGFELTVSQQLTVNADVLWMPYMFKKKEEVFRVLQTSGDLRYYVRPKFYYTHSMFDGFYLGPYVMWGQFNIGIATHENPLDDRRWKGWGLSAGMSLGYKFYLSRRFRLDLNLGIGYAHMQYDTYKLGGEWAEYAESYKDTKWWIGPTKFGVHLVFNIFR
jgi:hypothetical protein